MVRGFPSAGADGAANGEVPRRPPRKDVVAAAASHTHADRMPPAMSREEDRVADVGDGGVLGGHAANAGVKSRHVVQIVALAVAVGGGVAGAVNAAIGLRAGDHPVACVASHRWAAWQEPWQQQLHGEMHMVICGGWYHSP